MYLKRLLWFIFFAAVLIVIFVPVRKKLDIEGEWTVCKMIINGKDVAYTGTASFYGDKVTFYSTGKSFVTHLIEHGQLKKYKDSLVIDSGYDNLISGVYSIKQSRKLEGIGERATFLIELELKSKNKLICLYKIEAVKWNQGIPKGKP